MGKQAFGNKKRLLTGNMNLDLKRKIIKCTKLVEEKGIVNLPSKAEN